MKLHEEKRSAASIAAAKCKTPHYTETELKERFLTAYNSLYENRETLLEDCRLIQHTLSDCSEIDTEISELREEIEVVAELTRKCIAENSNTALNQEEYNARYESLVERYNRATDRLEVLEKAKTEREAKSDSIGAFMFSLSEQDEPLTEFDDRLWLTVIDTVTAHEDGRLVFNFKNGAEITA